MKRLTAASAFLSCLLFLVLPIGAASYVDNMGGSGAAAVRTADANLELVLRSRRLERDDRYQLQVGPNSQGKLLGGARYQVRGAGTIILRLYTVKGTYVSADSLGNLQLGSDSGVFSPNPASVLQARFHPADGKLYAYRNGWQTLERSGSENYAEFRAAPGFEGTGLIGYGVNLYALTAEGKTLLSLTRTSIRHMDVDGRVLCAEDFVCSSLPGSATGYYVELNDISADLLGRDSLPASLAWVVITGDNLLTGSAASEGSMGGSLAEGAGEDVSILTGGSSLGSKSASSASSVSSAAPGTAGAGGASTPNAASSKFEGVIVPSQSGSRSGAKSGSSGSSAPADLSGRLPPESSPSEQPEPSQPEPHLYEVHRASPDSGPDWGIILYLIAVACIILYLLMRPGKGRP